MALIKKYPEGSDITILDTIYQYPRKDDFTGKWSKDHITITYKDNITGKKDHETIYNPKYTFYKTKPDVQLPHNYLFIGQDKVEPVECKVTELEKTIAQLTNNMDLYHHNRNTGNRYANRQLHHHPTIFGSDIHVEDHYRARFAQQYQNRITPIDKAFFDIEVDTIDFGGDIPENGECPVNAISYINCKEKTIEVLLLRNENNPQIAAFEGGLDHSFFDRLYEFLYKNVGGYERAKEFGLDKFKVNFTFFNNDLDLIRYFFGLVHITKPDFLMAWNLAFDFSYLHSRLLQLGVDPVEVMTHPDFKERICYYKIDQDHFNEFAERGDIYMVSGYTVYLDQLIQYASRRKGQSEPPNYKLDTIGEIEAKVNKLDYSHITTSISKLPYLSYETFVFYNIFDTIVQYCIEDKTNDIGFIAGSCVMNDTRFSKGHRQTIYIMNSLRKFARTYGSGYMVGNNITSGIKTGYPGAWIAHPMLLSDFSKFMTALGEYLNIFDNCIDFDLTAMYPSITVQHNLTPPTQIGKIIIPDHVHELENPYNFKYYDRAGSFIEDFTCESPLEFNKRWFNLAGFKELLEDLEEYRTSVNHIPRIINNDGTINCFEILPESVMIKPFTILDNGESVDFDISKYNEYRYSEMNRIVGGGL